MGGSEVAQTEKAPRMSTVAVARSAPADWISVEQDVSLMSFSNLQSLNELLMATPVSPSISPAVMISEVQSELELAAQSSTAFETSSEALARSVAAVEMS